MIGLIGIDRIKRLREVNSARTSPLDFTQGLFFPMRESFSWSLSIGRWFGVPLRIHLFFLLFAMLVCCVEWHFVRNGPEPGTGVATILLLLGGVLIHELAHVLFALNVGGRVTQMTLMPWGGSSEWELPDSPKARLLVHTAGLMANASLFGICALVSLQASNVGLWELVNPFVPHSLIPGSAISIVHIAAWVNFQLLIVNLIPVYPFDAGQIIRNLLMIFFPAAGKSKIESGVLALGTMVAISLIVSAWFLRDVNAGPLQPTWFVLLASGTIVFFSTRYGLYVEKTSEQDSILPEDLDYLGSLYEEHGMFGDYDLDDGDSIDPHEDEEMISQWLQEKQEAREQLEREIEQEEERQVDSILKKLHNSSVEDLTDDERAILYRVSARYRRRRQIL